VKYCLFLDIEKLETKISHWYQERINVAKVEHILGINHKFEVGSMGHPKKPKI